MSPPSSPLFPYTTLFRSVAARRADDPPPERRHGAGHCPAQAPVPHQRRAQVVREQEEGGRDPARQRPPRTDRKSTRLNSSHLGISYAVFCLKKKKNKKTN